MVFFAHLLILEYPEHYQNLISSSLYYPTPRHKISSQSVHNFLSNVVHKQTNQRYQKHNLLCQGGNYVYKTWHRVLLACPIVISIFFHGKKTQKNTVKCWQSFYQITRHLPVKTALL